MNGQKGKRTLIVGQGLAGTIMAWQLHFLAAPFQILDQDGGDGCSMVAGGMINPISPRLPTLSWNAHAHLPEAETFYRSVEEELGIPFYQERTMLRPLLDAAELERWRTNARKKGFEDFLCDDTPNGSTKLPLSNTAALMSFRGATLDVPAFLQTSRAYFDREGLLTEGKFEPAELRRSDGEWVHNGLGADRVLLCQGTAISGCPFFGELPLRPNKGEILTLEMPDFPKDLVLNRGFYMIPKGNGKVMLGATYDHEDLSPEPTAAKRKELLDRMEEWIPFPYSVLDHQVGFRPTTPDTRPYVGFHKEDPALAVFNGLGSKGVAFAPYWGKVLAKKLGSEETEKPSPEVHPWRFERNK